MHIKGRRQDNSGDRDESDVEKGEERDEKRTISGPRCKNRLQSRLTEAVT